jgi:predicted RNase H-like HicB family nuclease
MTFDVIYERDDSGWWVASIPAVPGCHTQGRSISQARQRIREALAVALDRPDAERVARAAELIDDVRLPRPIAKKLAGSRAARARAEAAEAKSQEATQAAAAALTDGGMSVRDAAELLGLSHQRVQQLAKAKRAAKGRHAA